MRKKQFKICWLDENTKHELDKFRVNNKLKTYSDAVSVLIKKKEGEQKKNEKMFPKW